MVAVLRDALGPDTPVGKYLEKRGPGRVADEAPVFLLVFGVPAAAAGPRRAA
jgi:hypothetical protein